MQSTAETDITDGLQNDTAERVAFLNRNSKIFHAVLAQQFDTNVISELCELSEMIRAISATRQGTQFLTTLLNYRRAMLYFTQPSTRTFLSFTAACQVLGLRYNTVRDPKTSSEVKGESEEDTVRVLSQYFDIIIMRHPKAGFAEHVARILEHMPRTIPVINGGSGKDQHPTQALLDVYTLFRCFTTPTSVRGSRRYHCNPFVGKTIAFVGDLKRGRTVRSLTYLLARYPGVKLVYISPPELAPEEDIVEYMRRSDVEFEMADDLQKWVGECDAIYMTRLQDEHDVAGESKKIDYSRYSLTLDMAPQFKPNLVIMHPLPRRGELDEKLDSLPQAKYWAQVRNGMWMRAALIALIFEVDGAILEHYQNYYTL